MHTSRSDITTGSRRCCNRATCPFYMCPKCGCVTPNPSAQDGTSTEFLYFGENFRGQNSATGGNLDFRDCRSDTEMPSETTSKMIQPIKSSNSNSSQYGNYSVMLRQIIQMSKKLLEHVERQAAIDAMDKGTRTRRQLADNRLENDQFPDDSQAGPPTVIAQLSDNPHSWIKTPRYSLTGGAPSAGLNNIPLEQHMLHIEPVHLTIPFTLHFQSTTGPSMTATMVSPSGLMQATRPTGISGSNLQQWVPTSGVIEPVRAPDTIPPSMQPPIGGTSSTYTKIEEVPVEPSAAVLPQFPYSVENQTDLFVSQGKFPPITVQGLGHSAKSLETQGPSSQRVISIYPGPSDIIPGATSALGDNIKLIEVDKAVQTEGHSRHLQSGATDTGISEEYTEIDSHRNNTHIDRAAQAEEQAQRETQVQRESQTLEEIKTEIKAEVNAHSESQTLDKIKSDIQEAQGFSKNQSQILEEAKDQSASKENQNSQELAKSESQILESKTQDKFLVKLESQFQNQQGSQALVDIKTEIVDEADSGAQGLGTSPQQLPSESLDFKPSTGIVQQTVSFSYPRGNFDANLHSTGIENREISAEELEQQRQIQLLLEEQKLYEGPPPALDLFENKSVSSKLPQSMLYPSQFGRPDLAPSATNSAYSSSTLMSLPLNMEQKEGFPMYCRCVCSNKKPRSCSKKAKVKKSQSITRLGEDVFFSAHSDSENEAPKKQKCRRRKTCSKQNVASVTSDKSPIDMAVLQVLERMMLALDRLDSASRQNRRTIRSSSARFMVSSQGDEMQQERGRIPSEAPTLQSVDMVRNMQRRNFKCLNIPISTGDEGVCEEESYREISYPDENREEQPFQDNSIPNANALPCCVPYLMIMFDPQTGLPSCCIHSPGRTPLPCQDIPVISVQQGSQQTVPNRNIEGDVAADAKMHIDDEKPIYEEITNGQKIPSEMRAGSVGEEQELLGNVVVKEEIQIINETHIQMVKTEEYNGERKQSDLMITLCAETQTEGCVGPFPTSLSSAGRVSMELLEELHAFREELCESEKSDSCMQCKSQSDKSRSGGDIRTECECCHCRSQRDREEEPPQPVSAGDQACRTELKTIVDVIITDLEAMEKVRRQNSSYHMAIETSMSVPKYARQSFPVTIAEVTELGKSSLYVKWIIHDCKGVGGYEIYVDGYLTNRYFNARHEAAVVCQVDVSQPHKIALLAKPKEGSERAILGAGDVFEREEPTPMPSHWRPSIYLYEPQNSMDYCKLF